MARNSRFNFFLSGSSRPAVRARRASLLGKSAPLGHETFHLWFSTGAHFSNPRHEAILSPKLPEPRHTPRSGIKTSPTRTPARPGPVPFTEAELEHAAEYLFHRAIITARQHQSKAWELRTTMSLARLWQRQNRRGVAHDLPDALYRTRTERLSTPDLLDAKILHSLSTTWSLSVFGIQGPKSGSP